SDSLDVITAAGYIGSQSNVIEEINKGPFEWTATDAVLVYYPSGQIGLFYYDQTNDTLFPFSGPLPSAVIKFSGKLTTGGGSPTEQFPVTGASALTDRAFVQ